MATSPTFVQRNLNFQLSTSGGDSATLPDGLRASVTVSNSGGLTMCGLNARIWGMTRSLMNKYTSLGHPIWLGKNDNTITVQAGDAGGQMATIFQGIIQTAWAAPDAPDVPFVIEAWSGLDAALKPTPPTTVKGASDAATIMEGLASKMGYQFQNGGVQGIQLYNTYLAGTYWQQAQKLAEQGHFNINLDNGVLAIWPMNDSNSAAQTVTIDKDHGMVGYPQWTAQGLIVTTLFNPSVKLGGLVNVTSSVIDQASNTWSVIKVDHELETQMNNGKWFTRAECTVKGLAAPPST